MTGGHHYSSADIIPEVELGDGAWRIEDHPIRVWRFADAPAEFQALSPHGGDEDWLAHVPAYFAGSQIDWLEQGAFGNRVSEHPLEDGSIVFIGAHS
jgi:hypothetical protein